MSNEFKPRRVVVSRVIESRYDSNERPLSWDERVSGYDRIVTDGGETINLLSDGQQSTPKEGWKILLTEEDMIDAARAYKWTLYGIPTNSKSS